LSAVPHRILEWMAWEKSISSLPNNHGKPKSDDLAPIDRSPAGRPIHPSNLQGLWPTVIQPHWGQVPMAVTLPAAYRINGLHPARENTRRVTRSVMPDLFDTLLFSPPPKPPLQLKIRTLPHPSLRRGCPVRAIRCTDELTVQRRVS
jgi:hypothetical protein